MIVDPEPMLRALLDDIAARRTRSHLSSHRASTAPWSAL